VLADGAIGFLFEGFIGLGRWDIFVPWFFRGGVLSRFAFPFAFAFDRHSIPRIEAIDATHRSLTSYWASEQGLGQTFADSQRATN
jgi:hypothetical protein